MTKVLIVLGLSLCICILSADPVRYACACGCGVAGHSGAREAALRSGQSAARDLAPRPSALKVLRDLAVKGRRRRRRAQRSHGQAPVLHEGDNHAPHSEEGGPRRVCEGRGADPWSTASPEVFVLSIAYILHYGPQHGNGMSRRTG